MSWVVACAGCSATGQAWSGLVERFLELLKARVPDVKLLRAMKIFSPQTYPQAQADLHGYGVSELK